MRLPRLVIPLFLVLASGLVAAPALSSRAKTANASIRETGVHFFFRPHALTIHRGDSVRWRWCPTTGGCSAEHNVVGFLKGHLNFKHPRNASSTRGITAGSYSARVTRGGSVKECCPRHMFSVTGQVSRPA